MPINALSAVLTRIRRALIDVYLAAFARKPGGTHAHETAPIDTLATVTAGIRIAYAAQLSALGARVTIATVTLKVVDEILALTPILARGRSTLINL